MYLNHFVFRLFVIDILNYRREKSEEGLWLVPSPVTSHQIVNAQLRRLPHRAIDYCLILTRINVILIIVLSS